MSNVTGYRQRLPEVVFALGGLLFFSIGVGLIGLVLGRGPNLARGQSVIQLIAAVIFLITTILLIRGWRDVWSRIKADWLILSIVALVLLSPVWSVNANVSLRKGIALLGTTMFALWIVIRFDEKEFLRLLMITLCVVGVASALFAIALPQFGIHFADSHAGAWRGVYPHKNNLGWIMAVAVSIYLIRFRGDPGARPLLLFPLGLSLILLLMSGSRTSWVVVVLALIALVVFRLARAAPLLLVPGFIMFSMGLAWLINFLMENYMAVFNLLNRDPTMTGRTALWLLAANIGMKKPWLGHGFGAFWLGEDGASSDVWLLAGWQPPHGHNSYLDIWLELGVVGLGWFLLGMVVVLYKGVKYLRATADWSAAAMLSILCIIMFLGLSADVLLKQNSIYWVMYIVSMSYIGRGELTSHVPKNNDIQHDIVRGG